MLRRILTINDTKIQYLSVGGKIYEVVYINWLHSYLEAEETDLAVDGIEASEVWNISYFEDFHVKLINQVGVAEIIDFREWMERKKII